MESGGYGGLAVCEGAGGEGGGAEEEVGGGGEEVCWECGVRVNRRDVDWIGLGWSEMCTIDMENGSWVIAVGVFARLELGLATVAIVAG